MNRLIFKNGKMISVEARPYIVAELNSSHNGKIETAKKMIDAAKASGCDCVKFQSWSAESLYSDEYYKENPISKRIVKKFSLMPEALEILADYCRNVGIDFSSTPYSEEEVDFLSDKLKVPFIKIASMEINNTPFLKYIGRKGVPVILSSGMSTIEELHKAVSTLESVGNRQICILHCVSVYPAAPEIINLNNIVMLRQEFPEYVVGYSDHTIGPEVAAASVALGAALIEKHFTLDNKKMGMDNNMATEPEDMKMLVTMCHNVHAAMGSLQRSLTDAEMEMRMKMRRSLVAAYDLAKGTVLTEENITAKRPGDGIPPDMTEEVLGKRLMDCIKQGYKISLDNLE